MGLAEWFRIFCTNIQVQNVGTISARYKAITQRLNTDFWITTSDVVHSSYVGSYGRNTAIQGFSDLDMIFQLPWTVYIQYNRYHGNGQAALLQAVEASLGKIYSTTSMRADGQVVLVPFPDGITYEVTPVFINKDGSYIYPDVNNGGRWQIIDQKLEIEAIRRRNIACRRNLIPLCRMMRSWREKWSVPISGLLVDTLAYQFVENYACRDLTYKFYDCMCRDFFKWMSEQDENQEFWKAPGSGRHVYGRGLFQDKAKRCYDIALEAIAYETIRPKKAWPAKQKWREIFGTAFPE